MTRNFLFHRVNPVRDKLWDPMDVSLFEKCIKYISERYVVTTIEDLALSSELYTSNKYATIMFDDGYKDNITYAAPILTKYKCKASFYIVTDCISSNTLTWTHQLEFAFLSTKAKVIQLDFDFLPENLKGKKIIDINEKIALVKLLKPVLKKTSDENRVQVLNLILETFNDVDFPKLMMNWDDIRELKNEGHYIGSHTVTHAMLGNMSDENKIKNELLLSGDQINEKLGYFPLSISYPVGSYNDTTKKLSREAGYKLGLAVKQNIYDPKADDLFEISRIELYNEPWWKTRLRISNKLEDIKTLIKYR